MNLTFRCRSAFLLMGFAIFGLIASAASLATAQPHEPSPQVLEQIQALQDEKEARSPAQQKISSHLLYALKMYRGEPIARGVQTLRSVIEIALDQTVLVDIKAQVTDGVLRKITALGGEVLNSFAQYGAIRARLPLTRMETLADLPEVKAIRPADEAIINALSPPSLVPLPEDRGPLLSRPLYPSRTEREARVQAQLQEALPRLAQAHTGEGGDGPITMKVNTSQGDVAHRANLARSTFGVNGAGIRIGVLSDGVNTLAARQLSGDLPSTVTVLAGQAGSGDAGTAMLEIVHDLAPGAALFFATGANSPASFAQNILALQTAGCDIIVDDISYLAEPVFQDGIIAQAVNSVTAGGALYFSSAGNSGNKNDGTSGVWEGDFAGATSTDIMDAVHSFSGDDNNINVITADSPSKFTLQWSDAFGTSANDYDLYLFDNASTVTFASTNVQNGSGDPFEFINSTSDDTDNFLYILKHSGAVRYLHLNANGGRLTFTTSGQIWGHSAAVDAFSVAAVNVATAGGGPFVGGATNPVETYSSDGRRRVFYTENGTAITPGNFTATGGVVRQKPNIAAATCVTTATPGFTSFCGTSAAAPHAAAIAALMLEANPSLVTEGVRSIFSTSAFDIEAVGVDRDSGVGILDAFLAVDNSLELEADLSITKTDSATSEIPGTPVTYTITAANTGLIDVTGVTVTDTFPGVLTGCAWTCVGAGGGTCLASGSGHINTSAVNLPSGGSATFTATCTISAAATGSLANTATITAPAGVTDPTPGNNSATDTDILTPQANLAITKTDGVTNEIPGTPVTYTITATNAGPIDVTGVTVTDTFPGVLMGCAWTCGGVGGGICPASGSGHINTSAVNLPSGGSATFTATCMISAAATGSLANTATITAPVSVTDPTPGNNSATDTDILTPQVNLAIIKTDGVTNEIPGTPVTYTITATNAGPIDVTGVTVTDTFPGVLMGCAWTCGGAGGGTCPASGSGHINTSAVNLPSGGSATFTATCMISAAATGSLANTATITAPAGVTDPTPGNNSATDTDTLNPCSYTLTPPNQTIGASGGVGNVVVIGATQSACAWTAVRNAPWITVTGGSAGTGNGTVTYSVGANPGPNPRRGTMTIAGKTVTVSQATPVPGPCTISFSPTSAGFPAAGGTGAIPITASTPTCSRSARSHVSWITITAGGTGTGMVHYTVAVNQGPSARAGRITVNSKSFTVTQTP